MTPPLVVLLTDFGALDAYVGVMKGVVLSMCPPARFVDLSHGVSPQDIEAAAFLLDTSVQYFPPSTIFLCVVDPGVGSDRRALVVDSGGCFFVGPDNGLLSWALAPDRGPTVVWANRTEYFLPRVSRTFHGRDVFAPLAAHLANGVPLTDLGDRIDDPVRLSPAQPEIERNGRVVGEVQAVDGFGNLITNVGPQHVADRAVLEARVDDGFGVPFAHRYADVPEGSLVALWGSSGYLEIAQNCGNAATLLGVSRGFRVTVLTA